MKIGAVVWGKLYPNLKVGWPEKWFEEESLHIVLVRQLTTEDIPMIFTSI